MSVGDKWLRRVAWFIAANLVAYYALLGYYAFHPVEDWLDYRTVKPVKERFAVNEPLKFRTHIKKNKNIVISFNDVLYCRDGEGKLQRYSNQTVDRLFIPEGGEKYAQWPYSPGVAYPTECCLRSTGHLHLPLHVERDVIYDGCSNEDFFRIVYE